MKKVLIFSMSLILKALNVAFVEDDYKLVYKATKGVVFIGTPHRDVTLSSYLSKIMTMTFPDKISVAALAPRSRAITEITHDFIKHAADMYFASFYEARERHVAGVFSLKSHAK